MRRSFLYGLLLLLVASVGTPSAVDAQTADRLGYINSQTILESAPGAREAQQQFNEDMQGFRTEVQQMAQQLEQMIQQYEQQQLTLSPDARQQREQAIREQQAEYQQRVQALDQQAGQRQAELVQPVMDRITEVIEEIRAEGGYALIFDVAAGSIISADPALDLTDEVVRRLQATGGDAAGGDGDTQP
jgi:outer membrane protein